MNGQEVIGIYGDRQTVIDDGVSQGLTLKKGQNIVRAAESDKPLKGYTVSVIELHK